MHVGVGARHVPLNLLLHLNVLGGGEAGPERGEGSRQWVQGGAGEASLQDAGHSSAQPSSGTPPAAQRTPRAPGSSAQSATWKYAFHLLLVLVLSGWSSELSASICSSCAAAAAAAAVGDAPATAAAATAWQPSVRASPPPAPCHSASGAGLAALLKLACETSGLGCEPGAAASPAAVEPSCLGSTISSCGAGPFSKGGSRSAYPRSMGSRARAFVGGSPANSLAAAACRWVWGGAATAGEEQASCPAAKAGVASPAWSQMEPGIVRPKHPTATTATADPPPDPHLAELRILAALAAEHALPLRALRWQQAKQQAPHRGAQAALPRLIRNTLKRQRPQRPQVHGRLCREQPTKCCRARRGRQRLLLLLLLKGLLQRLRSS